MNEAWQTNAKATSRTLIHMEDDFGQIYRKEYLNEELLYYPYIINDEYHALLKQLSLNSEMNFFAFSLAKRECFCYNIIYRGKLSSI